MVPAAWRGEMTVRGLYGAGLLGYAFFLPGSAQGLGLAIFLQTPTLIKAVVKENPPKAVGEKEFTAYLN